MPFMFTVVTSPQWYASQRYQEGAENSGVKGLLGMHEVLS